MGMEQDYKAYAQRREDMATTHFGPLWLNQEKRYVHPFRIFATFGTSVTAGSAST